MSETYELAAERRERVGKGAARAVRREGRIPAVIYGGGQPPVPITLPYKEVDLKIRGGGFLSTVATIKVDGKSHRVIPKDYQLDPVRDFPVHVDFLRVARGAMLTVDVPVHFEGEEESVGLKRGGVLNIVRHTVEVTAPADAIPDHLTANIAELDINDAVKISNVTLPANVTPTITDRDFTIATVAAPAGFGEDLDAPVEEGETELIAEEGEAVEGEEGEGEAEGEAGESSDKE